MLSFKKALSQAKVKVMMAPQTAFISSVMLALDLVESDTVPTASTDGLRILINPEFFLGLSSDERVFLLLHETWHVVKEDPLRMRKAKHPKIMNFAQDFHINNQLIDEGFKMIQGGLSDAKYKGWSVVQIYNDLIKDADKSEQQYGEGSGNPLAGDVEPVPDGASKEEIREQQVKVAEILAKAAMRAEMAKQAGSIPEDVIRRIEEIRNPKLPWHQVLENYMHERVFDEYSWSRRNRRVRSAYLPALWNEGMGEVRCYLDCSGSISQKELSLEVKEMMYIKEIANPLAMSLHAFSTVLGKEQRFERDEDIKFDADASGGTCLRCVWDDLQQHEETEVAVIFTDGYVSVPPLEDLECDVVFVIVNNPSWTHPDATVIHMEINHGDEEY